MNNELRQLHKTPFEAAQPLILNTKINNNYASERRLTSPFSEEKAYEMFLKAIKLMPQGSVLSLVIENNAPSDASEPHPANDLSVVSIARQQILSLKVMDTEEGQINGSVSDNQLMARIHTYMTTHIKEECLCIEDLAQACTLSRSQLFRKIKAITHTTPADLVRNYRLDTAYNLLKTDSTKRISEVMYAVGFTDAKHFGKLFKKRFGMSPQKVKTA